MSEKESGGGDFRYAVGESKVPWHAVGEFYDGRDAVSLHCVDEFSHVVEFCIEDDGIDCHVTFYVVLVTDSSDFVEVVEGEVFCRF